MPHEHYIRKTMKLPASFEIHEISVEDKISVKISLPRKPHHCPHCDTLTDKVHDYREQSVQHCLIDNKSVYLVIRKRRYHCPNCGKRFDEDNKELIRYQRHTMHFHLLLMDKLADRLSISYIAKEMNTSISAVYRALEQIHYPRPSSLPAIIAIDEFRGNLGEKFQCLLTDPVDKKILDVLPSRKSEALYAYFDQYPMEVRKQVKFIVMDLSPLFRSVMEAAFPNAEIIADKFHVKRLFLWALENVRKRVQKQFGKQRRIYFKRSRKLLLKDYKKLNAEEKQQLSNMLSLSPDLEMAYGLKERFNLFLESNSCKEILENYKQLWLDVEQANLNEFTKHMNTINEWYRAVYLSITTGISNGYTEGQNNNVKVLKRISYGCRNFKNFRARILHIAHNTQDKCEKRKETSAA